MATELGQAYVQIMPSAKGISGSIQGILGPEAEAAGQSAGAKIGSGLKLAILAGVGAAAAGLGAILTQALPAGADLQQSFGGIDTLYNGAADAAKNYAKEAYKAGIDANTYAEQAVSMGAALKNSLGGDSVAAMGAANTAILDMADNAAKMGTPIESLQMAYQGFAKQNYTMLDNLKLGYGGTKSEMERLLADAEKLTGVKYDINNLADVNSAIHAIQGELGLTGVAAEEASTTFSGSLGAMKAAWTNVMAGLSLGDDLGPALQGLAQTASDFLFGNFLPMVGNVVKSLPGALVTFFTEAAPLFAQGAEQLLSQFGISFEGGLAGLGVRLSARFQPIISGFQTAFGQLPGFFQGIVASVSPVIDTISNGLSRLDFSGFEPLISAILPALQAGFQTFMGIVGPAIDTVVNSFVDLWNAIQPVLAILADALMPVFQVVGSFLGGVFAGVLTGISGAFDLLRIGIEFLTPVFQFLVDAFTAFQPVLSWLAEKIGFLIGLFANFSSAGDGLRAMMQSAWSNIQTAIQTAGNVIGTVIDWVKLAFSGAGSTMEVVKNIISLAWMALQDGIKAASSAIGSAIETAKGIFTAFGDGVASVAQTVMGWIDNVKGVFDSVKNIDLSGAGAAIMNGFLGGLKSAWGAVTNFVGGIASWIAKNKGPISYDKKLLIPAGRAIMSGLNRSLIDNFKDVQATVGGMAGAMADQFGHQPFAVGFEPAMAGLTTNDLSMSHQVTSGAESSLLTNLDNRFGKLESLLSALVDKDNAIYLDGEVLAQNSYQRQYGLMMREGI